MKSIPWLVVPVAIFNFVALFFSESLTVTLWQVTLLSTAIWTFTLADFLIALCVLILYLEILKSTRTSAASILDHTLSLLLFIACLIEFIAVKAVGKSTFFLITLMCLIDVVAGFTITISTARRDIGLGGHVID